jgi:hypothetical protein
MQVEDIDKLTRVSPNTSQSVRLQFQDPRFWQMWCPFHGEQFVTLLITVMDWGELWFLCGGGCPDITRSMESVIRKPAPIVATYVTARDTFVYESRWMVGASR